MSDLTTGEKTGIKTVLQAAAPQNDAVPGAVDAVQLPLLPLSQMEGADTGGADLAPAREGPGRPAGSRNRSTAEWRDYLLRRHGSPLDRMGSVLTRSIDDIARELGFITDGEDGRKLSPMEALEIWKIQLQCAKELTPYVHQKQPMAIDGGGAHIMQLVINGMGATPKQAEDAGLMRMNFIEAQTVENQTLSGEENQNSVAADSAAESNAQKTNEENKKAD